MNIRLSAALPRTLQRRLLDQLKNRLVLIIILLVGCFVLSSVVGGFAVLKQQEIGAQKIAMQNDENTLLQAMIDQETGLRGYITTNNTSFLDPLNSGRTAYASTLQQLKDETAGTNFHSTATALALFDDRASAWSDSFADVQIANVQAGNVAVARSVQTNLQGKNLFDALRRAMTVLQQDTNGDFANLQLLWDIIDIAAFVVCAALTVIAVLWLWNTFTYFSSAQRRQLDMLKLTAAAFGAGNLAARVQGVDDVDLHEVGETFNAMAEALQEQQSALRDRDILEHVSQLNRVLTVGLDLTDVMNNFLRIALPLLDIQIGALYLYDRESDTLRLFAAHGVQPEELQQTVVPGHGLIGRVALERKPLMIAHTDQQEAQQVSVQTLLGKTLPASLYHLPLFHGDALLGVFVAGSIYPMREQTRNVFHVIASNLSSTISNTQAYTHIRDQASALTSLAREQEEANQALLQQRDELTALNAALEEANLARSRFLSTMSHELRTPLTSIIGFGQMLLHTSNRAPLNERQTNNVNRILKNAQHLLTLINDVLDLAKVEAGRMDVNASEVNLPDLLNALVDETRSVAVSRDLRVAVEVADEVKTIETDPVKLRQIVLNLLSNALKFTEKGSVTISVTPRNVTLAEESEQVAIAVRDSGIGIAPEQQKQVFEAFYQVDNSNSRSYGGTGLGLSIVHEFTTLLGGKIEIESQPGQGTTFTILLPRRMRDRQSLREGRLNTLYDQGAHPSRVEWWRMYAATPRGKNETDAAEHDDEYLVVAIDDNPDVLQLIAASLEQSPYRVVGVQDATRAVSVVQELHPHVITLDIMMPRVNGWQILHQLKSNPATAAIPVILLTVLEDRSAGYVLGADEYLVKPVARDALLMTLRQFTSDDFIRQMPTRTDTTHDPVADEQFIGENERGATLKPVLLVHKGPDVYALVERLAVECGYVIKRTEEGQDVVALIEKALPDMVLMLLQVDYQQKGDETPVIESQPGAPDHEDGS